MDNYDSMHYRQYTTKSERDKALHILEGILKGISFNEKINPLEAEEILNWCILNKSLINHHPFTELIPLIENALEDGVISNEEAEDILWVCKNYTTRNKYYDTITSDIQRLQGLLHGILADGTIDESEIYALKDWVDENDHLANIFPYDEIYGLLVSVLKDKKIDDEEKEMLMNFFVSFVDTSYSANIIPDLKNKKSAMVIGGVCAIAPEISFTANKFCFTGVSSRTKRVEISKVIEDLGGIYHDSVTKDTKYLIIGNNGNPCWAFACYGRKVEKAIEMRKAGCNIIVVHENDFWDSAQDAI